MSRPAPSTLASTALPAETLRRIAARAATLSERALLAETASPPADGPGTGADDGSADASAVLQFWQQAFGGGAEAFGRRLEWQGLNASSLARALAGFHGPPPAGVLAWTAWLDRFAAQASGVLADWERGDLPEAAWTDNDEPPFIEIWTVLLRAGREALSRCLTAEAAALLTTAAMQALERQLIREVSAWAERATFERFREVVLEPETAASRSAADTLYRRFITDLLEAGLLPLWSSYPVLARQAALIVERWVDSTAELLSRLRADMPAVADCFAGGAPPGSVAAIEPALSDPHHGRRRVAALRFASGLEVVYKPRSLAIDQAYSALMAWASDRGLPSPPPGLAVLDRQTHGWVAFARHAPLAARTDARAYFRRSGSLLCLMHVLRATDLHMENVLATPDGPVVVDLEPLFQPVKRSDATGLDPAVAEGAAAHGAPDSCLSTGLVSLFDIAPDGSVFDMGGLRGAGTGTMKLTRRVWEGQRTDALRYAEAATFTARVQNRVLAVGETLWPDAHADDLIEGFGETYRWMLAHRDALLAADGPIARFAGCGTRVIPRATNQYMMLSAVLANPRYQRDGARRSAALDVLLRPFAGHTERPAVWEALTAERDAIESLDVPYFSAPCDETGVYAGGRELVRGYFSASGLDGVRQRIAALSDDDRLMQEELLACALADSPQTRLTVVFPAPDSSAAPPPTVDPDAAGFLEAARWIGAELAGRSRAVPHGLTWRSARAEARQSSSCPHTLYQGTTGTGLFFAALYEATRDAHWAEIARAAFDPVMQAVADGACGRWNDGIGIGDGLGSLVYGLVRAGQHLDAPEYHEAAALAAASLAGRIEGETEVDVLSGLAGGVLAFLALHRVRPSAEWLTCAAACGMRLIQQQEQAGEGGASGWRSRDRQLLLGFAHGTAGIAYALDRLAAATGDAAARDAASGGRQLVGQQYQPASANWPVAFTPERGAAPAAMLAWCHGAPGILLSEVLASGFDASTDRGPALTATARWMPVRSDHLCCGTLGRADILLSIGQQFGRADCVAAARALGRHVVHRARETGHFRLGVSEFEYRVSDPGLFRGLAGAGYALLRLSGQPPLPSVLAFETA